MLRDALRSIGIDVEDLAWQDLALCQGMNTNDFYDNYESSDSVQRAVDQACLSCPVLAQCLRYGNENGEYGVWGGVFLTAGKADKHRNSHKTTDIWMEIKQRVGELSD